MARRLGELPQLAAAFATGGLSYSKVRALTRVATDANQAALVELARCMTASHLERTVRTYRQVDKTIDGNDDNQSDRESAGQVYQRRTLTTHWNPDSTLSITAVLPAAEGAMVLAALQRAHDALFQQQRRRRSRGNARTGPRRRGALGNASCGPRWRGSRPNARGRPPPR